MSTGARRIPRKCLIARPCAHDTVIGIQWPQAAAEPMAAAPAPATPCLITATHMASAHSGPGSCPCRSHSRILLPPSHDTSGTVIRGGNRHRPAGGGAPGASLPATRKAAHTAPLCVPGCVHPSPTFARRPPSPDDTDSMLACLPSTCRSKTTDGQPSAAAGLQRKGDERAGEQPIAHATPVLEVGSGARAFGSGRGRIGSDIKRPHRPTLGTGGVSKGGVSRQGGRTGIKMKPPSAP